MQHSRNAEGFYMAAASFVDQRLRHEQSLFNPGRQRIRICSSTTALDWIDRGR